ncbi:hypothetical protein SDC9_175323 [bioreactor metagenome]|uniref:Uncharacterized protein n=1 Tax=bioreactor metagenome TaxID=1076179 RepID=A0A645GPR0_9ZZZZ
MIVALVIASMTPSLFAAGEVTGKFYIGGKWRTGTMLSKGIITLNGDIAYPEPPWAFVADEGRSSIYYGRQYYS